MSDLGKRIGRVMRREVTGGLGFGAARSEKPRAMLLAVLAASGESAKAAVAAGADVAIVDGLAPAEAAAIVKGIEKGCTGARLAVFDEAGAKALKDAGCDFVISPIDGTASAAVDPESMGQVIVATSDISDTTLRALPPLGLDALYVERDPRCDDPRPATGTGPHLIVRRYAADGSGGTDRLRERTARAA